MMTMNEAWTDWWNSLGHVARSNRDCGRYREAFEAGYLAALEDEKRMKEDAPKDGAHARATGIRLRMRSRS